MNESRGDKESEYIVPGETPQILGRINLVKEKTKP
jgi:hypothetical protein